MPACANSNRNSANWLNVCECAHGWSAEVVQALGGKITEEKQKGKEDVLVLLCRR